MEPQDMHFFMKTKRFTPWNGGRFYSFQEALVISPQSCHQVAVFLFLSVDDHIRRKFDRFAQPAQNRQRQ
jgi:hypothetical protein